MFDRLSKYIASKVTLSGEELFRLQPYFNPVKLSKRAFLLQAGEVCKHVAFVNRGLLRQYLIDESGAEHTTDFAMEDYWIGDRESLATQSPSKYYIEALEDSDLLLIAGEDMKLLEREVEPFKELMSLIKERRAFTGQHRLISAISQTAEEKYNFFLQQYPGFARRVPQHMIASFLGIKPETLSRIRARIAGK